MKTGNYSNIESMLMLMTLEQKAIGNNYKMMSENLEKTWASMRELHSSLVSVSKGSVPKEAIDDLDVSGCDEYIDDDGFIEVMNEIRKKVSGRARLGGYLKAAKKFSACRKSLESKRKKLHERIAYLIKANDMGLEYNHSSAMKRKVELSIGIVDARMSMILDGFFQCKLDMQKDIEKATFAINKVVENREILRSNALRHDDSQTISRTNIIMNSIKKDNSNE